MKRDFYSNTKKMFAEEIKELVVNVNRAYSYTGKLFFKMPWVALHERGSVSKQPLLFFEVSIMKPAPFYHFG